MSKENQGTSGHALLAGTDCIPCLVRQGLAMVRRSGSSPREEELLMRGLLAQVGRLEWDMSPPELSGAIQAWVSRETGCPDPYLEDRALQQKAARDLLPELKQWMFRQPDHLRAALKIAAVGNSIDLGAREEVNPGSLRQEVSLLLNGTVHGPVGRWLRELEQVRHLVYLADNAGEIVWDSLLIEAMGPERVTLVVRGAPVLNDATLKEAKDLSLPGLRRLMDNGSSLAGTVLQTCSEDLRRVMCEADMVLAKGQGNFESLSGWDGPVWFLFLVKCRRVATHGGVPLGQLALLPVQGAGKRPSKGVKL